MKHYVYKITNTLNNRCYIGSRSCQTEPIKDIGIEYFSSSTNKIFMKEQQEVPMNFKYEVLEEFNSKSDAQKCEALLLKTTNALSDPKYYNGRIKYEFNGISAKVTKNTISYLGNLIKLARLENGITQHELAERAGTSRSTIGRLEEGDPKVAIGTVFECCFILQLQILDGDEKNIKNLAQMMSYMNKLLPKTVSNSLIVDDNF